MKKDDSNNKFDTLDSDTEDEDDNPGTLDSRDTLDSSTEKSGTLDAKTSENGTLDAKTDEKTPWYANKMILGWGSTLVVLLLIIGTLQIVKNDSQTVTESTDQNQITSTADTEVAINGDEQPLDTVEQPSQDSDDVSEDAEITDLSDDIVYVVTVDNLDKLPEITPASFVNYLAGVVQDNFTDEDNCVSRYGISLISSEAIGGGITNVDVDTLDVSDNCGGGGRATWYLQNEVWQQMKSGGQSVAACEELEGIPVYSEFMTECSYLDGDIILNPNGSIYDAKDEE